MGRQLKRHQYDVGSKDSLMIMENEIENIEEPLDLIKFNYTSYSYIP